MESRERSFFISPRELDITWAEDIKYWDWINYLDDRRDDQRQRMIEVPRLIKVWYLKIKGKMNMARLKPGTKYEVVFLLMLEDPAIGWQEPVTLKLKEPAEKSRISQTVFLDGVLAQRTNNQNWKELKIGEFTAKLRGEIIFSLSETKSNQEKSGLLVKGVVVRPMVEESKLPLIFKFLQFFVSGLGIKFLEIFYEDISRFLLYLAAIVMKRGDSG